MSRLKGSYAKEGIFTLSEYADYWCVYRMHNGKQADRVNISNSTMDILKNLYDNTKGEDESLTDFIIAYAIYRLCCKEVIKHPSIGDYRV